MLSTLINGFRGGSIDFTSVVIELLALLIIIFIVLPFHEWAHAFVALKLGDTSVKYRGRLSFNPVAHIDPFGAFCLILFGFGWAKPVPIDARNFKKPKRDMALTALAGPVANLVAALVGSLVFYAVSAFTPFGFFGTKAGAVIYVFLQYYISVNVWLAVFNLIPIPPLDGSKIMFAFLPDRYVNFFYRYQNVFFMILFVCLFTGLLSTPLMYLSNFIINGIDFLGKLPFLWAL